MRATLHPRAIARRLLKPVRPAKAKPPAKPKVEETRKKSRTELKARKVRGPADVTVFGDSHAALFLPFPHSQGRLGYAGPPPYTIAGQAMYAASIAGFRPGQSKLHAKEKIRAALPEVERLVLAYGQVDLELGYYHRLAVKGEEITPAGYVDWLLDIYAAFVDGLDVDRDALALKGVNLTSLVPQEFAIQYVRKIVQRGNELDDAEADARLAPFMLDEDAQNAMHLAFNAGLAAYAARTGCRYFDLVAQTAAPGSPTGTPRLADAVRTAQPDHHLADTVAVRRMHYDAIGAVFDLDADRVSPYFDPAKRV